MPAEEPAEVIRENAFGGTSFRDIYFSVNEKMVQKSRGNNLI